MKIIQSDGQIVESTFDNEIGKNAFRHTASHILAQAVKRLFPETKLAIGPSIKDGFYYDFDREIPFTEEELSVIEAEMKNIVKANYRLERVVFDRADALKLVKDMGEPYKEELIRDLPENEEISFFKQGDFMDLCAGPHVAYTSMIKAFKLTSLAGAYWRGSEKNKMLTRIYGTAFSNKTELEQYLNLIEEAKKRDHRKLGKELKLFTIMEEGPGFPFFLPKGITIKNELITYWREIHRNNGYQEIDTPIMLSRQLWETSGHWGHYQSNMYTTVIDEADFAIKPMNCPGALLVYNMEPRSYKELPLKFGELGLVHRHEKSGVLHGLMRVRCFTQDDAHIFMSEDQIVEQIQNVVKLIDEVYSKFGFKYRVELSTMPEDHLGSVESWDMAIAGLKSALEEMNITYVINEGDGAFYGPKIDFHLEDSIGRTWQCGTIQLDFQLPMRFEAEFIGSDGQKHRPIMIHRVVYGSIERFIGILIEHYAGKFPIWLAPVQVKLLPITDRNNEYTDKISSLLQEAGIRYESDKRQEKTGFKVREAQVLKIPYMLIIGDKEQEDGTVSVRKRDNVQNTVMKLEEFVNMIKEEVQSRV